MPDVPFLELRDAVRSFRTTTGQELPVLRGVSLTVHSGTSHAVLGRSGSGKSTLMALLGLLDQLDAGTYRVNGQDVHSLRDRDLSAFRGEFFGFVYQRFFLMPHLTALQNVELALVHASRAGRRQRRQSALEALDRLGLADRAHHRPAQLSGGEQQRTAIARALALVPRVVLADEPTGALDEKTAEDTVSWLLSLCREQDIALVVVTHDPQVAARMDATHHLVEGQWAP
ncbi:ABC transporter ATP-binding protein [Streptomyces sp. H39-C1]|uniref:ABC transporter ATP-binding protein n=1 Tax=Streptomyces sp. H39-C1 TaxID=3004355 RepID=UPI0022AEEA28|nr:ABC transporter ATP-binding protein [Streptomyces sp. H39-C1]MCZ4101161.1 ABC transporter ATP-binding protein [Streptomyces sp. H39-C1]